jgi:diamine N-acetyltransferase
VIKLRVAEEADKDYIGTVRASVDSYLTGFYIGGGDRQQLWWDSVKASEDSIVYMVTGDVPVGYAIVNHIDYFNRRCYGQVQIQEAYRGKGYGTEAWQQLLVLIFDKLGLHKCCLEVITTNERAISLYRKLGFEVEGTLRSQYWKDGKYVDSYSMGLLRED